MLVRAVVLVLGGVSWLCAWSVPALGVGSVRGRDSGRRCRCCELCAWWRLGAGAGCWLRAWWRQGAGCWVPGAGAGLGAGAGAGRRELSCRCSVLAPASDSEVITTAASNRREGRPSAASDNEVPAVMGRVNLCAQHHTVLSLERSLSISAVGYLHSSGSVLADSCVKGCTVCAHTFARILFYAQRQAPNRQFVSACYTHNSRAGYCLALGE